MSKLTSIMASAILVELVVKFVFPSSAHGACPGNTAEVYRDHLGIEEKFRPPQKLDQGNLGVCWAFSLTYLLEYLYRSTEPSAHKSSISPMSVLMEACPNQLKFSEGASLGAPLRRLRYFKKNPRFAKADAFPYADIATLLKPTSLGRWVTNSCHQETADLLSYVNEQSIKLGREVSIEQLGQKVAIKPDHFHFDVLSPIYRHEIELPSFEEVRLGFGDPAAMERSVREHFARESSQRGRSPIAAALKDPPHGVVFSGYRQACCGNDCRSQVEVENWHGDGSQWVDFKNLDGKVESLLMIRPCAEGSSDLRGLQPCGQMDPEDLLKALISGRNEEDVHSFLRSLSEKGRQVISKIPNDRRRSIVLLAIRKGMPQIARSLVRESGFWTSLNEGGQNLLHEAAEEGDAQTIQFLLDQGVSMDHADKNNITPMGYAAFHGNSAAMRGLIEAKKAQDLPGLLEHPDRDGLTPLFGAVMNGHEEAVDLLLEKGAHLLHKTLGNESLCDFLGPENFMTDSWLSGVEKEERAHAIKNRLRTAYLAGKATGRYKVRVEVALPCLKETD